MWNQIGITIISRPCLNIQGNQSATKKVLVVSYYKYYIGVKSNP